MKKTVYKLVNDLVTSVNVYLHKKEDGKLHCYSSSSTSDSSNFEGVLGINLFETKEELLKSKIKALEQSISDNIENIKYEIKEIKELKKRIKALKEEKEQC